MLLLFLCFTVVTCACPENCIYSHNERNRTTASCRLEKNSDYDLLMGLPKNTIELECTVKGRFIEQLFQVQHLLKLEKLVLWPDKFSRLNSYSSHPGSLGFDKPDIFYNLRELRHLGIHISLSDLNATIFQSLEHLQVLDLSHTEGLSASLIASILSGINEASLPLVLLNLTRVHITEALVGLRFEPINVRTHIYQHLKNISSLKILDFRDNGIVQLQGGLTEFLLALEELYLGENVYTYFANSFMSTMCSWIDMLLHPALRKLYYSFIPGDKYRIRKSITAQRNLIDVLFKEAARCIFHLHYYDYCGVLNCMCKREMEFPCSVVDVKRNRRILSSRHQANCIASINIPIPINLEELTLRTAPNAFVVPKKNYGPIQNYCFLPDSKLSSFDISNSNLDFAFLDNNIGMTGLPHLSKLNLENNNLDLLQISRLQWFSQASIKILLLSGNRLMGNHSANANFLDNAPALEVLKIPQCHIVDAPPISHLTDLVELDISQNEQSSFPNIIHSMRKLQKLDLSSNKIPSLPASVTNGLDKVAKSGNITVDLSGNPLLCQCHTLTFVSWMKTTRVTFASKDSLLCRYTTGALIFPWDIDLNEERKLCNNFYPILYSVIGCVLVVALVAIGVVLYKKQWTLRYLIHTAREILRRKGTGGESREYKYDAFVAYCSRETAERQWVHLTLVPKLEGEYGLKVCIHHRDFLPGRDIPDNIVDAINNSRKTLLVLSPSFLDSDWCNFEVRMARAKLVEERRDSIVLVLYRSLDIPGTRIPRKLMNLLDRQTYAEWTTNPEGQELFWNKPLSVLQRDVLQGEPYCGLLTGTS